MLEIFHKAHVGKLQADAPGAGIGQIVVIEIVARAPAQVAVSHEGGEVAGTGNGGQTFGAVLDIAVIAGGVPAENAGRAPVHLVFHQGLDKPALPLGAASHRVHAALEHVKAAHGFHIAVVDVQLDIQGIKGRDGHGQARPEQGAVGLAGMAQAEIAEGGVIAGQGDIQGAVGRFHAVFVDARVLALHAVHDPGGQLHAVECQGQHEGKEVHIVQIVLPVVFRAAVLSAGVIVVERAHPQGSQAHIVIEPVIGHHGGGVAIHDGGTAGHVGQGNGLEAHAEAQVRLGHHPVKIGILDLDGAGGIGPQGAAAFLLAPYLVPDFKEDRAGQGFGGHGIQLQADTLCGAEGVIRMAFRIVHILDKAAVAGAEAHQPFAGGLEVNGLCTGVGGNKQTGRQNQRHDAFHTILLSFLT